MSALRTISIRRRHPIATDRIKALSLALREEFSTPFSFYDGSTGELLGDRDAGGPPAPAPGEMPAEVLAIAVGGRPHVGLRGGDFFRLVLPIREPDGTTLVAIGNLPALAPSSQAARLEQARLQKWVQSVHSRLTFTGRSVSQPRSDHPHRQELRALLEASKELTDLLAGLGGLGESGDDQGRILQRAAAVLPVETLIWVPRREEEPVSFEGERCLSAREGRELARWLSEGHEWDSSGSLIVNQALPCALGNRFAGIMNLMALSVDDRDADGWLIALNKRDPEAGPDRSPGRGGPAMGIERLSRSRDLPPVGRSIVPFRRLDVALLKPFASLLGLQSRSSRRHTQVQDLFAGLIRSLTAAIDAKDSYTCGHSERVARVAVEVARELGLPESELADVYLAGLLHDIGKVGVPDSSYSRHAARKFRPAP